MKDLARQAGGALQTLDDVALSHLVRVAGRGQNYAERRARIPLRVDAIERTAERRLAQQREIGLEAHEDRLGFRIAAAAIELQNVRCAVGGNHESGVQEAGVRHALGGQSADSRFDDLAHDAGVQRRGDYRRRRIGAHAAGVGSAITVVAALVILGAGERQAVRAVRHDDEARLLAGQELLDHHLAAGLTELAGEHRLRRGARLLDGGGDHHALAGGQAARLDHQRRALAAQPRGIEAVAREGRGARRRNAMASQEFLGKGLGALEPRGRLARSEALQSARGECVDRACHQRCLRPDDGELDLLGGCQLHEPRDVLRRDVHVAYLGFRRGARVAGSHQHVRDARGGGALPGERVLAATPADDQNFHGTPRN